MNKTRFIKDIPVINSGKEYFNIVSSGYNNDLHREEIQIHAGNNGNIFIIKIDTGFIINVYGQNDICKEIIISEKNLK